jgi:hypothetical protein
LFLSGTHQPLIAAKYIGEMIGGEILLTFDKFALGTLESVDIRSEYYTAMNEQADSNFATEQLYNVPRRNRASILLPFTFNGVGVIKGIYPELVTP